MQKARFKAKPNGTISKKQASKNLKKSNFSAKFLTQKLLSKAMATDLYCSILLMFVNNLAGRNQIPFVWNPNKLFDSKP